MNVNDFMAKLAKQTTSPMARNAAARSQTRRLEKVSLNFIGNLGRYQVIPMVSEVTDFPYVSGNVRQVNIPRKTTGADGSEQSYNAWIHLCPLDFYQQKDPTGHILSSLTAEDEKLLREAHAVWEELYGELDGKNNYDLIKDLIRRRHYTLFHGYCLNQWKYSPTSDGRVPDRSNFSALFCVTTKSFMQAVEDNIAEKKIMEGGSDDWIEKVYNNNPTGRDGFIIFSISRNKSQPGFTASVTHEFNRASMLQGITIPQEDLDLMKDPVATFLGWQASKQDEELPVAQRHLFNAPLIKEAIEFMTNQLAAIRSAKSAGSSIEDAIKNTTDLALQGQPSNPSVIEEKNTDPFHTPVASNIDPVSSAPVNSGFGNSAFTAPSFASFGKDNSNGDLPF